VTLAGLGFAAFSVVLGIQTLVRWMRGDSVAGFPTVILLLLILGTFVLLGLGVIGEYLARIHDEVRGRPRYLIQDRTTAVPTTVPDRAPPVTWRSERTRREVCGDCARNAKSAVNEARAAERQRGHQAQNVTGGVPPARR
jgi:hypothetical protein